MGGNLPEPEFINEINGPALAENGPKMAYQWAANGPGMVLSVSPSGGMDQSRKTMSEMTENDPK
ncbi:MAG: hypothetical protein RIC16_17050 [Rhodospirillales bacterium]